MRRVLAGIAENTVLIVVLIGAAAAIGVLLLMTWLIQLIAGIADDPNAGPYRQVR